MRVSIERGSSQCSPANLCVLYTTEWQHYLAPASLCLSLDVCLLSEFHHDLRLFISYQHIKRKWETAAARLTRWKFLFLVSRNLVAGQKRRDRSRNCVSLVISYHWTGVSDVLSTESSAMWRLWLLAAVRTIHSHNFNSVNLNSPLDQWFKSVL